MDVLSNHTCVGFSMRINTSDSGIILKIHIETMSQDQVCKLINQNMAVAKLRCYLVCRNSKEENGVVPNFLQAPPTRLTNRDCLMTTPLYILVGFSLCLNTSNMFNIAAELQQAQRKYAQEYVAFLNKLKRVK